MCKLRRCLANTRRWHLACVALPCFVVLLDCWRADENRRAEEGRAGDLVLESATDSWKRHPRIKVEIYSDDPATEHCEVSVLRRLYFDLQKQFTKPQGQWISAHHDVEKVRALRPVAATWIEPGEKWEIGLKPGRCVGPRNLVGTRGQLRAQRVRLPHV
jgi:hypothetical protein